MKMIEYIGDVDENGVPNYPEGISEIIENWNLFLINAPLDEVKDALDFLKSNKGMIEEGLEIMGDEFVS